MRWEREGGVRVSGDRPLDAGKVQAPGVVRCHHAGVDGWRLFYTAVGPGRPFDSCQGYLSNELVAGPPLSFASEFHTVLTAVFVALEQVHFVCLLDRWPDVRERSWDPTRTTPRRCLRLSSTACTGGSASHAPKEQTIRLPHVRRVAWRSGCADSRDKRLVHRLVALDARGRYPVAGPGWRIRPLSADNAPTTSTTTRWYEQ